jgi:hypothetical protein
LSLFGKYLFLRQGVSNGLNLTALCFEGSGQVCWSWENQIFILKWLFSLYHFSSSIILSFFIFDFLPRDTVTMVQQLPALLGNITLPTSLGQFKQSNNDVCGSVHHSTIRKEKSNKIQQYIKIFIIPYLYEAQHVSGDTPPIIRSLKLH